jgi:hypothetical protein
MNRIEALQRQQAKAHGELLAAQRAVTDAEDRLRRVESLLTHAQSDTPVSSTHNAACGACGEDVRTEALFSAHYVIPNWRLANIGHCPQQGNVI